MTLDIASLRTEETRLEDRLKTVREAIRQLQELCDHKFERDGHDSHYDYERCKICGKTQRA